MGFIHYIIEWLFPSKCILCRELLDREETDLCRRCRMETDDFPQEKLKVPFIDSVAAVWYYKGNVRRCLLRYKFHRARHLAVPLGKMMAMQVLRGPAEEADLVTWVPISPLRRFVRGYDQDELLARVLAEELGIPCVPLLKKLRHNRAQSGIDGYAKRRANVLGVYGSLNADRISGAKVLLVDDILTTGATASECARILLTAGAKEVHCAVVASAHHK